MRALHSRFTWRVITRLPAVHELSAGDGLKGTSLMTPIASTRTALRVGIAVVVLLIATAVTALSGIVASAQAAGVVTITS